MKKYVGAKMIEAEPMTRGAYNEYRGWTIPTDKNPKDEGYLVRYSDGYVSWSPKKTFDAAYREYDKNELPATAILMNSHDYKERFEAEYRQCVIRYEKLKGMLDKWDKDELNFEPTCPRSTYDMQMRAMADYIAILEARSVMEGVEL